MNFILSVDILRIFLEAPTEWYDILHALEEQKPLQLLLKNECVLCFQS